MYALPGDNIGRRVEVSQLYEVSEGRKRDFDVTVTEPSAVGMARMLIKGRMVFEPDTFDEPRTYVYVNREDPLGDSCAIKPNGVIEDVTDDEQAAQTIIGGVQGMPLPFAAVRMMTSQDITVPGEN